jgi:hypothetical protein
MPTLGEVLKDANALSLKEREDFNPYFAISRAESAPR